MNELLYVNASESSDGGFAVEAELESIF